MASRKSVEYYNIVLIGHGEYKSFKVDNGFEEEEIYPCSHSITFIKHNGEIEEKTMDGDDIYELFRKFTNGDIPKHFLFYKDFKDVFFDNNDGY